MEVTASSNLTVARHFLVPSPILSAEYIDNLKWQKLIEMQIVVLLGPLIFYPPPHRQCSYYSNWGFEHVQRENNEQGLNFLPQPWHLSWSTAQLWSSWSLGTTFPIIWLFISTTMFLSTNLNAQCGLPLHEQVNSAHPKIKITQWKASVASVA